VRVNINDLGSYLEIIGRLLGVSRILLGRFFEVLCESFWELFSVCFNFLGCFFLTCFKIETTILGIN
jgi:hypothetical protein